MTDAERDDVAASFRDFARWAEDTSPLSARLARAAADDSDLLELAAAAPPERARPNLLLAAVQYLLFREDAHPLAAYYPSVVDAPRPHGRDCEKRFRGFCLDNQDALRDLLTARRTQTNAVRRSAVLYPAFAHVAAADGPLALVELGASAGLNLLFDRYGYRYERAGGDDRVVGVDDSPVTITSEIRGGDPPLPADPPAIHSRVGIDLHPLDPTDRDDADWLRALVWPEHGERRRLLEAAIAAARDQPPRVRDGDLLADLPDVLAAIPDDVPVCVYNTQVLYQVPDDVVTELRALLEREASERDLHWLSGEHDPAAEDPDGIDLTWTRAVDGEIQTERLAEYQPHGEWLAWRA